MDYKEKLAAGFVIARKKAPYFDAALTSFVRVEVKGLAASLGIVGAKPTMGVTDQNVLMYEREALEEWSVEEIAAVLIHEVGHILRDHSGRCKSFGGHPTVFNIAGDCIARGSRISMGDGSTKPIEEICVGDVVIGVQNGVLVSGCVQAVLARPRDGIGVEFVSDTSILRSTQDHRFLVEDGYVTAREIIGRTSQAAKVFRLRKGVYPQVVYDIDNSRNRTAIKSSFSECSVLYESQWNFATASVGKKAQYDAAKKIVGLRNVLCSGNSRWGGNDYGIEALQYAFKQDILQTVCVGEQHQQFVARLVGSKRFLLPSLYEYEWHTMLENDRQWIEGQRGLHVVAALFSNKGIAGAASDFVLSSTRKSRIQSKSDSSDAPDVQRTAAFEYAVCSAKRKSITKGEIYYDLVTTCHSFIAEGFVVHNCEINDDIVAARWPLPGDPVLPKKFGAKDGLTAEEYYPMVESKVQWVDSPCACGSGAGRPFPNEPKIEGRTEAEIRIVRHKCAEEISKRPGKVPGGWAVWAKEQLAPPKIRWQDKLARATRRAICSRPGAAIHTWKRPSRRQAACGYGPGRPVLPGFIQPVPEVAMVVDTSGSMGKADLMVALREAQGVLRATGASVTFMAIDAAVHSCKKVRSIDEMTALLLGGGGTDFRPAFEQLQKARTPPEVIIFATDGCGPAPQVEPAWCKTIWLLVGNHIEHPCSWGEQIEVSA